VDPCSARDAGGVHLDILAIVVLALAIPAVLDSAAARWGVDSRFRDVRSDSI
jgi:hypothetical protein